MGIASDSAKTLRFNNSLLRGKNLFKVIGENSSYKFIPAKIDPDRMSYGLDLVQKRKDKRALIIFLLVYPVLIALFALWILAIT